MTYHTEHRQNVNHQSAKTRSQIPAKDTFQRSRSWVPASSTFPKKEENQPRFAIQASVFPCPFLHVHQSAKPDVQMLCVGKQALVWANTASTRAFWWARNQAARSGRKQKQGWGQLGTKIFPLLPLAQDNHTMQGLTRWAMLGDIFLSRFPSRLSLAGLPHPP